MISIIIASADKVLLKKISKNIANTIGTPYEIIATDNSTGEKGLCEIYNSGTNKAKYNLLCFVHEDIEIRTPNWGLYINNIFETDENLGIAGVAGCSYKSAAPSGWVCYGLDKILHYNIYQHFKYSQKPAEHLYCNPAAEKLTQVACIDGVWFCTPKKIALEFPFDEKLLKGFHGYDTDFSLSVNQKYKVMVTYEVMIEHFSEGKFKKEWLQEVLVLSAKWQNHLPLNIAGLNEQEMAIVEVKTCKSIIKNMADTGYSIPSIWAVIRPLQKRLSIKHLLKLYFYALKK